MNLAFRSLKNFLVAGIIIGAGYGCSSSGQGTSADEVAFEDTNAKIATDMDKVIHDLPSPTEVPYLLKATGSDFNPDLPNGLTGISGYQTNEDEAALNLGVYATDMGYFISYDKVQESMDYMEACQKLAEALGVSTVFDMATMEKFQNNISNPDSLDKLFSEAIVDVEDRLENADRASIAALILTGSFIEGLYLTVKMIETYPKDILDETNRNIILEPLVKVVLDQKKPLLDVIAMLKDLPQDDIIAKMITELNILRILYDGDLADIQAKISSNTGDFVLTQDMLIDITTEVQRVRKDIIEL